VFLAERGDSNPRNSEHRLIAAVESDVPTEPSEIHDRILRAVREFTGSEILADDQTLLAIRYTGASVAAPAAPTTLAA
jgi:serine phosphatase RsbU (regulator of sigma subunit)